MRYIFVFIRTDNGFRFENNRTVQKGETGNLLRDNIPFIQQIRNILNYECYHFVEDKYFDYNFNFRMNLCESSITHRKPIPT